MDLRPRNKDKELAGKFRHAPKTRIEQVYDTLSGRTSSIATRDILDHNPVRKMRGGSVFSMLSTTPNPMMDFELTSYGNVSPKRKIHSPNVLPEIFHPTQIIS